MDKIWLVYQPVLSVVDKYSWYFNRFCRSWTILGGIFHGCVLLGQYWLVNQPVYFSFMDSNGWFISMFCLSWTILVGISPYVVCDEQKCSQHTKQWDLPTNIVHNRLIRLIYQPILSTTEKPRGYTNHYCP